MEFNVDKQTLCFCRVVREAKAEQPVDCDMTLPDYCPDVKSILNCSIEPGITSSGATGNRITAEGNALVRLVYVGDDDKIACFEQNYPLSKYVEMSALPKDAVIFVKAKTGYVNCRAVSPRRVDIHGCITLIFSAACCENSEIVCGAQGDGLQLKQRAMQTYSAIGCASKLFEMSEVVPLPAEHKAVKSVIRASALPLAGDVKTVSGKMLVKGDMQVNISYCSVEGTVETIEHTMPISQIVELDGVSEGSLCDIRLECSSLDTQLKADANGEMRQIDIAATVRANVFGYKELSCACTDDAYSIKNEITLTRGAVSEEKLAAKLDETFVVPCRLDFTGAAVGELLDCWCSDVTCVSGGNGDSFEVSGTLTLCVLYKNDEGKVNFAQRQSDYRYAKELDSHGGTLRCDPSVCVTAVSLSGKGAEVPAKVQLKVTGSVFACTNSAPITALEMTDARLQNSSKAAITVYFCNSGESLWDIAKKYNTSQEAVRKRNGLASDTIEKDSMLIIPRI